MATSPMPSPDQQQGAPPPGAAPQPGAAPDQGASSPSPSSGAPADQMQMLLAKWYQAAKQMATADPRLASGANKVAEGIQEMQTALVTPQQPTPMGQQPQY